MSDQPNWKRLRERLALSLPVRIVCRETLNFEWMEVTRLHDVTPFGAGFTLKRPTEKGRILHMTIPLPRQLRVFDYAEEQYRTYALVRHMRPQYANEPGSKSVFNVGVAFIGKRPPSTYAAEPWRRYVISTPKLETLANVEEMVPLATTDQRRYTRHNIGVDVLVEVLGEKGEFAESEKTVTEDISVNGATIFTTLTVPIGRFIRVTSDHYQIAAFAAIRGRSIGADGIPRIHVEFIDKEWPL
jgi:hypothetical protein